MKGAASYTSSVLMSMSAAALVAGDRVQVPTSATRMEAEERIEIGGTTATVNEVEIDARDFFKDGIKRSGTDMSLRPSGKECPRVVLSHFTDVEVPELGVKLPAKGLSIRRFCDQVWCEFLELEDAAKREELDEHQQSLWEAYGRYFDYARYRAESAPLVKTFGTLISSSGENAVVRWLDGSEEELQGILAERVSVVRGHSTRNFTAMARFVGYKLADIEDVRPDRDAALPTGDLSWMSEWQNG